MVNKFNVVLSAIVLLVLAVSFVSALPAVAVGSPDNQCQANGFDYGIAKFECGSTVAENGSYAPYYDLSVSWNECKYVNWTADPAVDGVLVKAATNTDTQIGGESGVATNFSKHDISHITFCANEPPVIPEFGWTTGLATILAAITVFFVVRRN
jgi:hypothetical protein